MALVGDNVYSWGRGASGQLGNGATADRGHADVVLAGAGVPLSGIVQLPRFYHEAHHSTALASDGTLYTWGAGSHFVHGPSSEATLVYAASYAGTLPSGTIKEMALTYFGTHILLK